MALSKARVLNVILSALKEGGGRRKMKGGMREGGRKELSYRPKSFQVYIHMDACTCSLAVQGHLKKDLSWPWATKGV